jgi:transaldolase
MCDGPRIGLTSLALPIFFLGTLHFSLCGVTEEEEGDPTGASFFVGRSTAEETAVASPYEKAERVVKELRKFIDNRSKKVLSRYVGILLRLLSM